MLVPFALCSIAYAYASPNFPAASSNLNLVNPLIGNTGPEPNYAGGMIPSVAPPFGMTRWVAQTHQNWVSKTPYNWSDSEVIHGFVGTHQPAIWMGESGLVAVVPGQSTEPDGPVNALFEKRGLRKTSGSESFGVSLYQVELQTEDGTIQVDMTASPFLLHLSSTETETCQHLGLAICALTSKPRPRRIHTSLFKPPDHPSSSTPLLHPLISTLPIPMVLSKYILLSVRYADTIPRCRTGSLHPYRT